jgi:uroporphyrinogen decarboxylase
MMPAVAQLHADIFHFGNAVDMQKAMDAMSEDQLVMGNVDPVLLRSGTSEEVREATRQVFAKFAHYPNFMLSTGCDVPAAAKWENIDAYFETVKELYAQS